MNQTARAQTLLSTLQSKVVAGVCLQIALCTSTYAVDPEARNPAASYESASYGQSASIEVNSAFLNTYRSSTSYDAAPIDFLSAQQARDLKLKYDDQFRNYEQRKLYGQVDLGEEQAHDSQLRSFSQNVADQVKSHQQQVATDRGNEIVNTDPSFNSVKKPVGIAGAAAAAYNGKTFNIKLNDATRMTARTKIANREGDWSLKSSVVDTSASYRGNANPAAGDDRVRVGVSRCIPGVDVTSSVNYGASTGNMSASMSRQVVDHLTAVVGTTQNVAQKGPSAGTVSLQYGLTF